MRRQQLTETQIAALFDPPTDQRELVRHYTLSAGDIALIRRRRGDHSRLGHALMLCYLRHPGRPLRANERPPPALVRFVAAQIDVLPESTVGYLASEQNRRRHAAELQDRLGFRPFGTRSAADLASWLLPHAIENDRLAHLAGLVAEECRRRRIVIPSPGALERLCIQARYRARREVQRLETAQEYGFRGEEWQMLVRDMAALVRALKDVERVAEMELGVSGLERRQREARERLEALLGTVDSDPKGAENRPHIYNYKPSPDPNKDTVIAAKECSGEGEGPVLQSQAPVPRKQPERGMVHGIAPDELVRFAPKLKPYLRSPRPTWSDIVDAADWLRHDLGVSKSLWGEACITLGRDLAAVALAIVSTKQPEHFRSTPGGYFHGMVAKARDGDLHLDRTVWAWRRASAPTGEAIGAVVLDA